MLNASLGTRRKQLHFLQQINCLITDEKGCNAANQDVFCEFICMHDNIVYLSWLCQQGFFFNNNLVKAIFWIMDIMDHLDTVRSAWIQLTQGVYLTNFKIFQFS